MKNSVVMFIFSVLDLFLQVLSKYSILYFDAACLIFQQFTCSDLKSLAFLNHSEMSFMKND